MPSRFEGFGLTAAEAMAAGVPLVATTVGSLPEVVEPPAGGVLVPPGDLESLVTGILRVLDSRDLQERLARSAKALAERFRWHKVAEDHLAFLERIAGAGKGSEAARVCA